MRPLRLAHFFDMLEWTKMKRILALFISLSLLFSLVGCANSLNNNVKNESELYNKAVVILDELGEDERVKDFRTAYDLLMNLSSDDDKFVSQLSKANEIFEKYDVDFELGDYYLNPTITITKDGIEKYQTKGAYYDSNDLLDAIVYPVLFEKYGDEAQCIEGLTAREVIDAIKATNEYTFYEKTKQYDGYKERWEYIGVHKSKYVINYHSNGLVENVTIPIVRSDNPLNDAEYEAFFENEANIQKKLLSDRIASMSNQFSTIFLGYEVLGQIFTDEEITIISNYIHSLSLEEIWDRDLTSSIVEPVSYVSAIVVFNYKGNQITINYGLNDICLQISGCNIVNPLTSRWYTLWCGLCLPEGSEETIEHYSDYINNNTALNTIIYDYSFDLDANEEKYKEITASGTQQTQSNDGKEDSDVQQSIPVEMSLSDTITTYGVIEQNNAAFPDYRLHLNTKLTIVFDEYGSDKVFECEYLYFYDDAELNGYFPINDFVGYSCEVTALLEDYRGGDKLFLINPTIIIN